MKDEYKVKQLEEMLRQEMKQPESEKYGAHLTHWSGCAKPINIDEGALRVLIEYYNNSGKVRATNVVVPNVGRFEIIEDYEEEYPGVDVEFIPKGDDNFTYTWPQILFERPVDGKLRLFVWADPKEEDYTHKFEWDI